MSDLVFHALDFILPLSVTSKDLQLPKKTPFFSPVFTFFCSIRIGIAPYFLHGKVFFPECIILVAAILTLSNPPRQHFLNFSHDKTVIFLSVLYLIVFATTNTYMVLNMQGAELIQVQIWIPAYFY